ncbi:hypothetical protein JOM56_011648, partial [Amanita muscaria]
MKSFKALVTLLTLAAALSCGANGSPTNVTTDSFIKRQSKQELQNIVNPNSLQRIVNAANHAAKSVCAELDLFPYDCILHTRTQILPWL